jgi:amidase
VTNSSCCSPPRIEETYALTRVYWRRPESASWDEWEGPTECSLPSMEIAQHLFAWDRFRRALMSFMQRFEVIVTPAMGLPAQPHGAPEGRIAYTLAYSLTGYPAVVLRVGTADGGLPMGVQIVARSWRNDVALAVAAWLEQRFGGWQMPVTSLQ